MAEQSLPKNTTADAVQVPALSDERLAELGRLVGQGGPVDPKAAAELYSEVRRTRAALTAELPKFEDERWSRKRLVSMERWLLASGLNPAQLRVVRALAAPVDRIAKELAVANAKLQALEAHEKA